MKTSGLLATAACKQAAFSAFLAEGGKKTETTLYQDFTIADFFGEAAVRDTYNRAFRDLKNDHKKIAEMYVVLNHKIWELYKTRKVLAELYDSLWRKLGEWVDNNLKGKESEYFWRYVD